MYNDHKILADMYLQGAILNIDCPYVNWIVSRKEKNLYGKFTLKDSCWQNVYSFGFIYYGINNIATFLFTPAVIPCADIHMYPDKRLCLYFPNEFSKNKMLLISRHIIPKCRAWADNYEFWKFNGHKWIGNQKGHSEAETMLKYYYLLTGKVNLFD